MLLVINERNWCVMPKEEKVKIELRYQKTRFKDEEMHKVLMASLNILETVLAHPDQSLKDLLQRKVEVQK